MKTSTKTLLTVLALGASAWMLAAQDSNRERPREHRPPPDGAPEFDGHRPPHPPPPVIAVLDANRDGVIDRAEIANASQALLQLDENGDGELTREELRPPPPPEDDDGPRPHGPPPPGRPGDR